MSTSNHLLRTATRALLLVALAVLFTGAAACNKSPAQELLGAWSIEREVWAEQNPADALTEVDEATFRILLATMDVVFRFNTDGTYQSYAPEEWLDGHYNVRTSNNGTLTLILDEDDEPTEIVVTFRGEERVDLDIAFDTGALRGYDASDPFDRALARMISHLPLKRMSDAAFEALLRSTGGAIDAELADPEQPSREEPGMGQDDLGRGQAPPAAQ